MQRAIPITRALQRWRTLSQTAPLRGLCTATDSPLRGVAAEAGGGETTELGPPRTWVRRRDRYCTGPYEAPGERPQYPKRRNPFARSKALINALHEEEGLRMRRAGRAVLASMTEPPRAGDILRVEFTPNSDMPDLMQAFTGIVMATKSRGLGSGIVLRNVVDGIAIERAFPLYSPAVRRVVRVGKRKVHRAKLYYLREKKLRESTFQHVRPGQ